MRHAFVGSAVVVLVACGGGDAAPPPGSADAPPTCVPTTCAAVGAECGEVDDGCGIELACGTCAAPLTCGGTAPHVCGALALAIDVTTVRVSGVVTANGQVPDQTCASDTDVRGQVYFYQEDGPASFGLPIPCAPAGTPFAWNGDVYPGVYRVAVLGAASSLPPMTLTVADGLEVRADVADLAYDITNHRVGGTITQNGHVPTQICTAGGERGQVLLEDKSVGSLFAFILPCDPPGTPFAWSGTVPPGTYQVSILGENTSLPQATHIVDRALVVDGDVDALSYDLVTHPVSGTLTLNGNIPGDDPAGCRGRRATVRLESTTDGAIGLIIPCGAPGTPWTFSGEAYAGPRLVTVTGNSGDVPRLTYRPGLPVDVSGPIADLAVDVTTLPVSATVTVNGAMPPACASGRWGEVSAYETTKGYNYSIDVPCGPGPFAFAATFYPGTYFVSVSVGGGESLILARALVVAAPVEGIVLDATAVEHAVAGIVTVNGAAPGGECTSPDVRGVVRLDDVVTGTSLTLSIPCGPSLSDFAFAGTAPPGSYRVTIFGRASDLPGVAYVVPGMLTVAGPTTDLRFDIPTRRILGSLTRAGGTPVCEFGALAANVDFIDTTTHATFVLPARCPFEGGIAFHGDIYAGTYDVDVYGVEPLFPAAGFRAATAFVVP
jgi:hypothetical protein